MPCYLLYYRGYAVVSSRALMSCAGLRTLNDRWKVLRVLVPVSFSRVITDRKFSPMRTSLRSLCLPSDELTG
jgi:hypothetical protein